jgi:hypothetical protein
MKTTKTTVVLLFALVLITVAATQTVVAMEKPKISNTRTASCLVKITTDEAVLPLSEFVVEDLLRSSGIAGKAAREVLEISPDIASELIEIEEISGMGSPLGGYGGYGGYGGGMDLPADATPGGSTPGASTPGGSKLGTTTTSRSTGPKTPTAARTPTHPTTRTPTTRTRRPRIPTTTTTPRPYPTRTTPTRPKPTLTMPSPTTTEQTILFHLRVDFDFFDTEEPIKPAAEEFMMALIDNLRSALSGAFDQYSAKLNKQLKLADEETRQAEIDLVQMQAKLRDISGSRDLSRQAILRDVSSLRQKLQTAIMNRASDESLYEATVLQIAEEQARRKKLVADDPITRELKSILDVHEKRLKDTQKLYESGSASAADLEDVKEKIIRARIELAKRQEEVSNPPGGLVLSSLNNVLADLSTKVALARQEISSFEEQLREAEELLGKADSYELLSLKTDIARQNLEETLLWRARLGRNIRSIQPPDVTVIGAE